LHHARESSIYNTPTKEMTMTQLRDTLIVSLLVLLFAHVLVAMCFPTPYGRWLQAIDNGRYEYINGTGE
jgi:hypothetical protein